MRVFSAAIETFLHKLNIWARHILRYDFRVRVARTRFHTGDGWTWPLVIVAIDDATRLGYFDSEDLDIGINKCLMYTAKDEVIKDLLRHELAHYFTYIAHRDDDGDDTAHGPRYQAICDKYGLPSHVRAATLDVRTQNDAVASDRKSEEIIAKIKKLMSLAQSDNQNEAALATVRANELLVKHNLDAIAAFGDTERDVEYCVKLVLPCKRSTPRIAAISRILREFLVHPVHASAGLEVTGTRANVENAEYIASYLNRELAAVWKKARAENRRLREKAFMTALAKSYRSKLQAARSQLPESDQHALMVLNDDLKWAVGGAYGGSLRSTSSSFQSCKESSARGAEAGSNLNIRRGVNSSDTVKLLRE